MRQIYQLNLVPGKFIFLVFPGTLLGCSKSIRYICNMLFTIPEVINNSASIKTNRNFEFEVIYMAGKTYHSRVEMFSGGDTIMRRGTTQRGICIKTGPDNFLMIDIAFLEFIRATFENPLFSEKEADDRIIVYMGRKADLEISKEDMCRCRIVLSETINHMWR